MAAPDITLSIVSHGQNALVNQLLSDIQRHCAGRVAVVFAAGFPRRLAGTGAHFDRLHEQLHEYAKLLELRRAEGK